MPRVGDSYRQAGGSSLRGWRNGLDLKAVNRSPAGDADEMTSVGATARQLQGLAWLGDVHNSGEGGFLGQRQYCL